MAAAVLLVAATVFEYTVPVHGVLVPCKEEFNATSACTVPPACPNCTYTCMCDALNATEYCAQALRKFASHTTYSRGACTLHCL